MGQTRTQLRREQRKYHARFSTIEGDNPKRDELNNLIWVMEKEKVSETSKTEKVVVKTHKQILFRKQLEEITKALLSDEESGGDEEMVDNDEKMIEKLEEAPIDNKEDAKLESSVDFWVEVRCN